jgi:predicted HicB family RNase H-like nuclease
MNIWDRYTYRIHWSAEDQEFVATVAEFPSLSWVASSPAEALNGVIDVAKEVVTDMQTSGENIPIPIGERDYSGHFVVRIPPEEHRQLAIAAAEQGVSLNLLAATRLKTAA